MNRYKYLDSHGEHVHLLDGKPLVGTSRVGSVLAKQGLVWYGAAKAVEVFGCHNPKMLTKIRNGKATEAEKKAHYAVLAVQHTAIAQMSHHEYFDLIDRAYRAHDVYMRSRAVVGKDLHAECEKFVRTHMGGGSELVSPLVWPFEIHSFVEWAQINVKRFLWAEGHCYSEKHWLGGISDAGYEKKDGTFGILDFKSSKEAYMEQFWQCAGYMIQIAENGIFDADGTLLYEVEAPFEEFCIFPFGAEKPQPQFNVDVAGGREAFLAELLLYKKMPKD